MSDYDTTNKAVAFVENGIFAKAGVENLQAQRKPIIKVIANVDGKDVEIALYFAMVYDEATGSFTDQYKLTRTGSKMLKGKVQAPYVSEATQSVDQDRPRGETATDEFDDDVPF